MWDWGIWKQWLTITEVFGKKLQKNGEHINFLTRKWQKNAFLLKITRFLLSPNTFFPYFKQTKHIINKQTGLCKLADYAHCYNLDENRLREDFFKDLLPENTDSISVLVALESVLKVRENISTQLIDSLDTDKIIGLVSEGKIKWKHDLSSEQNMFDFLQVYPQFTIVRR